MKPIKLKVCKICHDTYKPFRTTQKVCGHACAIELAQKVRATKEAKEYREAKERIKTRQDWLKEVQIAFNSYIRARDGKICISCGTQKPEIQFCAGHYRTRGAAGHLRFNEDNVHSQCNQYCNLKLSGNIINYRPRLIAKIGIERVEALENNNDTVKYTIPELKELKALYKRKLKEIS